MLSEAFNKLTVIDPFSSALPTVEYKPSIFRGGRVTDLFRAGALALEDVW